MVSILEDLMPDCLDIRERRNAPLQTYAMLPAETTQGIREEVPTHPCPVQLLYVEEPDEETTDGVRKAS